MSENFKKTNSELLKEYDELKNKKDENELKLIEKQLYINNTGLIHRIARKYMWSNVEYEDLAQIGSIGFIKAVRNFNISAGCELTTYAVPMIEGEIKRYIRDNTNDVKISRSVKQKILKIQKACIDLESKLFRKPTNEELAQNLNMSLKEVEESIQTANNITVSYLDSVMYKSNSADKDITLYDNIHEKTNCIEEKERKMLIDNMLNTLNDNEKKVITMRYYNDMTQVQVANKLDISQVQVSRIEKKALTKMRIHIEADQTIHI